MEWMERIEMVGTIERLTRERLKGLNVGNTVRTCMWVPTDTVHSSFVFFITLDTGPRTPLSLELSDVKVYEPYIRARLSRVVLASQCRTDNVGPTVRPCTATSPQSRIKSSFPIALIFTTSRRIPASASTNNGPEKGDFI